MTIGLFGGTFNPPHIGHLIVAGHVLDALTLDTILFVPAAIPPHKGNEGLVAGEHRAEMLRLAIRENSRFELSEVELARGGVSFTVDTLGQLHRDRPSDQFFLLIGMDNLLEFHSWKSPERILTLATVVVMTRPGFAEKDVPAEMKNKVTICPVPEIGIASRDIRQRVREGKSVHSLVPVAVEEYIRRNGLYAR